MRVLQTASSKLRHNRHMKCKSLKRMNPMQEYGTILRVYCVRLKERPKLKISKIPCMHNDLKTALEANIGELIDILLEKGHGLESILKKLEAALSNVSNAIFLDIVIESIIELDRSDIDIKDIDKISQMMEEIRC